MTVIAIGAIYVTAYIWIWLLRQVMEALDVPGRDIIAGAVTVLDVAAIVWIWAWAIKVTWKPVGQ